MTLITDFLFNIERYLGKSKVSGVAYTEKNDRSLNKIVAPLIFYNRNSVITAFRF